MSRGDRDVSTVIHRVAMGVQRYCSQLAHALPPALKQHAFLLSLIVAYWLAGVVVCEVVGVRWTKTVTTYLSTYLAILPLMAMCLVAVRALVIMIVDRPPLPLTQFRSEVGSSLLAPHRIANAIPVLVGMLVVGGTFTVIKASIPSLSPFSWDLRFEEWDRWLHGGVAPWQLLYPIFGSPLVTQVLNWSYNGWLALLNLVWVWQAFSLKNARLRSQFFLTFFLSWMLLGSASAALFSSAGPCFFGRVTGLADPFAPLMTHLATVNQTHELWALHAQNLLWELHVTSDLGLGAGISAMPSMHIAVVTLFALLGWRTHRWLGLVLTIYAVIIMIGSVHLGWHYAIDGYAAALGIGAIWWVVGHLLDRQEKRKWMGLAPGAAAADDIAPR